MPGERILLPVLGLEFHEGSNTIWVHGQEGTVLRIKCTGKITVSACPNGGGPHADVQVQGDIRFCVPDSELDEEVPNVH